MAEQIPLGLRERRLGSTIFNCFKYQPQTRLGAEQAVSRLHRKHKIAG